jgi:hypothetical protein
MLNASMVGAKSSLALPLAAADTLLTLPSGHAARYSPGLNNHTYLTVRGAGGAVERIKVGPALGDVMPIIGRAADSTAAQAFPAGSCVTFEWTPSMVCEQMSNCNGIQSVTPISLVPGTLCMASCDCVEYDSAGRITKVIKGTSC